MGHVSDDLLRGLVARVSDPTLSPGLRRKLVQGAARQAGLSERQVYRRLEALGWKSGRARRADHGSTRVTEEALTQVASLCARGRNKRGQANLPAKEAVQILQERGELDDVSYRTITRQLRRAGLDGRSMRAPEAGISRVSLHPNHVWLVDISVAIQWYFRDEETGKRLDLYMDSGSRFYEGKVQNYKALNRTIHRYLVVDHLSGAYWVQYYYSPGENSLDLVDFLWSACSPKDEEIAGAFPFRGLPTLMLFDRGSAFNNGLIRGLLSDLDVEVEYHGRKNPKASGAVETRHNHWQRSFEGRLSLRPAKDLQELNTWAGRWCAIANAERDHSRHGAPPMSAWSSITTEQLVEAPARDVWFGMAAKTPREGTVDSRLWLKADGRKWQLAGSRLYSGCKVQYRLAPFLDSGIRVWDAEGDEVAATEISLDPVSGFPTSGALTHVIGTEGGASHKAQPGQKLAAAVATGEVEVRLGDLFDDLEERVAQHHYLTRPGTAWTPAATAVAAASPLLGDLEICQQVAIRLGRALSLEEGAWWRARIGDGLSAPEVEQALMEFTAQGAGRATGTTT